MTNRLKYPTSQAYFDGKRVQVDLLQRLDFHVFDQTAQLGDRNPLWDNTTLSAG